MPGDGVFGEVDPPVMRARLVLEAAAGMAAQPGGPYREPDLALQSADGGPPIRLSAASTLDAVQRVVAGELDLAFLNPSAALTVAYRGRSPAFAGPQPVRAVTVLPSRDQCLFAVHGSTGLATIEDIGRRKYPLRLGLRGRETHLLHVVLADILAAAGFSFDDIVAWGGEVRKEGHIPLAGSAKFESLVRGDVMALFDEAVPFWADAAMSAGLTALGLEDATLARLEEMGYRRAVLSRECIPSLPEDVPTLDFSGWLVFVRDDADDGMVRRFCAALEARRESIPWEGTGPLPLDMMCRDTPDAPLGVPLHPAAESFWTERGYL